MNYRSLVLAAVLGSALSGCGSETTEINQPQLNQQYVVNEPREEPKKESRISLVSRFVYETALSFEKARRTDIPLEEVFKNIDGKYAEASDPGFYIQDDETGNVFLLELIGTQYDRETFTYRERIRLSHEGEQITEEEYGFKVDDILREVLDYDEKGLQRTGTCLTLLDFRKEYSLLENLYALFTQNGEAISSLEKEFREYLRVEIQDNQWDSGNDSSNEIKSQEVTVNTNPKATKPDKNVETLRTINELRAEIDFLNEKHDEAVETLELYHPVNPRAITMDVEDLRTSGDNHWNKLYKLWHKSLDVKEERFARGEYDVLNRSESRAYIVYLKSKIIEKTAILELLWGNFEPTDAEKETNEEMGELIVEYVPDTGVLGGNRNSKTDTESSEGKRHKRPVKEKSVSGFNSYLDKKLVDAETQALVYLSVLAQHSHVESETNEGLRSGILRNIYIERIRGNIEETVFTRLISDSEYSSLMDQFAHDYDLEREDFVNLQFVLINMFELGESGENEDTNLENLNNAKKDLEQNKKTLEDNIETLEGEISRASSTLGEKKKGIFGRRYLFFGPRRYEETNKGKRDYLEDLIRRKAEEIRQAEEEIQETNEEIRSNDVEISETSERRQGIDIQLSEQTGERDEREKELERNTAIRNLKFFIRGEYRNQNIFAELEARYINRDNPSRLLEIYELRWENGATIKVPFEREIHEDLGKVLKSDPGLLDRFGITLQGFGDKQESRLDALGDLLEAVNDIERNGLRPAVSEILKNALQYHRKVRAGEQIKPAETQAELIGRKIGEVIFESGYFDRSQWLTPDNSGNMQYRWIDSNELDGFIQGAVKPEGIRESIRKFINRGDPQRHEVLEKEFLDPLQEQERVNPDWKKPNE